MEMYEIMFCKLKVEKLFIACIPIRGGSEVEVLRNYINFL